MKKVLVVLGPTASGKSDLSVELALRFNGEVISADSRQVYMGLDIGTGKITEEETRGVPHHLLDVTTAENVFTVSDFKKLGEGAINEILEKGKLPIICGGTGFYIEAILGENEIPEVPPNPKLREELEQKTTEELFEMLQKLDPERAGVIDAKNKRRLVRAIEIAETIGRVPRYEVRNARYDVLKIGIKILDEELKERINKRLEKRIGMGMIEEAQKLHEEGLSFNRMRELGLEYGALADLLEGKITKEELVSRLKTEIWQYAKRQMTWFKRDKNIRWFEPKDPSIETEVKRFLEK